MQLERDAAKEHLHSSTSYFTINQSRSELHGSTRSSCCRKLGLKRLPS